MLILPTTLKAILKEVKKEMQHNIIIAWNLTTSYGFLCLIFVMWIVYYFFGLLILFLKNPLSLLKDGTFVYKTVAFTWVKTTQMNKHFKGMGYWVRKNPEMCLLATKGKPKRLSKNVEQLVVSPRQRHSQKPDCVRDRIVELCGDLPRIELFARQKVKGWDCWGNEV